ncbi:MAG: hypothetical protein IJI66_14480 [Erysipelotrichaceae bacterium]|nr:hypothetical protein [Erysipelotrichaceae bacterium]
MDEAVDMADTVNSEVISVSTENKPIKARDIRRAKWASIIAKCKKETKELGITIPKWCEDNGISEKSYWYYHRIISSELIIKAMNEGIITDEDLQTADFLEVDQDFTNNRNKENVTLIIGNTRIVIDELVSDSFLIRLLKAASHV